MKKLSLLPLVLLLAQCGPNKMAHPVAVVAHAEARQPGQSSPQGTVEPGDTVDLTLPILNPENGAMVTLANGKRGYVPLAALALPDSLKH